jgi:YD repeat-containing protein
MKLRALTAVLLCLSCAVVAATAIAGRGASRHGRNAVAPRMPHMQKAVVRKLRQRAAARVAYLHSPAARRARARSRGLYRGSSHVEALAIARNHFRDVIEAQVYRGLRLRSGERIGSYLNDNVALVDLPGTDRRSVARSSLPLRTAGPDGAKTPVDLALERHGARLESKAALAPTSFGTDARDGFALTDVGVAVHPVAPAGVAGQQVADKLFFSNVAADTDLVEMPVPAGVETYNVLRSVDSPEDLDFSLDMPSGATLRLVPGSGGLPSSAQVTKDGALLVDIPPAQAQDADGVRVPVAYRVDGDRLTLHVPHRSGGFRYPLLVDPNYVQNGTTAGTGAWAGWNWVRTNANYTMYIGSAPFSMYGTKSGMSIKAEGAINTGNYGNWYWTSPPNTYIYRGDWEYVTFQWLYQVVNEGLVKRDGTWEQSPAGSPNQLTTNYNNNYHNFCFQPACTQVPDGAREGVHDGNSMIYGMQDIYVNTTYPATYASMQGADTFSGDQHSPVIDSFAPNTGSGWHDNDVPTLNATFSAHDDGFGLYQYNVQSPAGVDVQKPWGCTGAINSTCPTNPAARTTNGYAAAPFPEGVTNLDFWVTDAVNNPSLHRNWPVKIDRSLPTAVPSGPLYDARNGVVSSDSALNVTASDPYSGVSSLVVKVDNQPVASASNPSPCDGCGLSTPTWTFEVNKYDEGPHTVEVVGSDYAGHSAPIAQWSFTLRRTDMGQEHSGYGFDWYGIDSKQDVEVNVANGSAVLRSRDLDFAQNQIDLPFERYVNTLWKGHQGAFGTRGTATVGDDVTLSGTASQQNLAFGDGTWVPFVKQADGTWAGPADVPMTLTANSDGSYDVAHDDSALTYHFTGGRLQTITQDEGATVTLSYNGSGKLTSVQDSATGTSTTFTRNAAGDISQIQQGSQIYRYTYGGPGGRNLLTFTDPAGNVTRYDYDGASRPSRVTLPDGTYWKLLYDASNRISILQHVTDPTFVTGPTTTYTYNPGSTVVTEPGGQQITYQFGSDERLTGTSATSLPADYQTCLEDMQEGGAGGRSDSVGDQIYCESQNRDAAVTSVDVPVYDPEPADGGLGTHDLCTAEDGLAECGPTASDVETPAPPVVIGGMVQPGNVPLFGLADDERGPALYDMSRPGAHGIFDDPHFTRLNVSRVRAIVPYDLMVDRKAQDKFNPSSHYTDFVNWYRAAKAHNLNIMVSFQRSSLHLKRVPSRAEYQKRTRAFMDRFDKIKTYSAWNEPNYPTQPLVYPNKRRHKAAAGPGRAAYYTYLIARQCRATQFDCLAVAGDFAYKTYAGTTTQYESDYKTALTNLTQAHNIPMPIPWAFHPYDDVRQRRDPGSSQTLTFIENAPSGSRLWLTEVGAFHKKRGSDPDADYSQSVRVGYLVDQLAGQLPVRRLYYYYFWGHSPTSDHEWATGLMDPGAAPGEPAPTTARPAYYQYQCRTNPSGGACPPYGQDNTTNP